MDNLSTDTDEFLDNFLPGTSPAMRQLRAKIICFNRWHRLAAGRIRCVLVTGKSGVGKERLVKLAIQHSSWESQARDGYDVRSVEAWANAAVSFAPVLCTAVVDQLAEAELFGYVPGAFTGAKKDGHPGIFGDDGVKNVLLDEIGDAPLPLQGKLLRIIQEGTFRRVGDLPSNEQRTNARIFAATHKDLALVSSGRFREDLYWRIIPFRLHLPCLHERREEIPALIDRILKEHTAHLPLKYLGLPDQPKLLPEEEEFARAYDWPGNVRQLADVLKIWLVTGGRLRLRDIIADMPDPRARGTPLVPSIVKARLLAVLQNQHEPYGTIGAFLDELAKEEKAALHDLVRRGDVGPADLERIFNQQKLDNIRSQLSKYRSKE